MDSVVVADGIFFALAAAAVFVLRRRAGGPPPEGRFRTPGYPVVPALFVAAVLFTVVSAVRSSPADRPPARPCSRPAFPSTSRTRGATAGGPQRSRHDARSRAVPRVGPQPADARDRSRPEQSARLHARRAAGAREAVDLSTNDAALPAAIAAHAGVDPDRVATAAGCSGANFLALQALLDPGDELLVETPGYDPIAAAATMAGAVVRTFERRFEEDWAIDTERVASALSPRTKVIAVSSPHNPSGVVASESGLAELERLARERGIRVLVDEVYADTLASGESAPRTAATRSDAFVSTSSLTKAYGLASLRCGWAIASPPDAAENPPGPRPRGRIHAGSRGATRRARVPPTARSCGIEREESSSRIRSCGTDFLASRPELACVPSPSSIAFPRFADGRDSIAFCERLFAVEHVTVVPGSFFGCPSHLRISIGGATDALREGLGRISRALDTA